MNILFNFNSSDASKPSFFEMFLQTQMLPSLKPVVKYIFAFLSQRYPRLSWAYRNNDELFLLFLYVLEKHYLDYYDGSFSENFYGLKRSKYGEEEESLQLTESDKKLSLFFIVFVPYFKDKLDAWYNRNYSRNSSLIRGGELDFENEDDDEDGHTQSSHRRSSFKRIFDRVIRILYPTLNAIYEGLFFIYQLLYMYRHTPYFTPLLHIQGLVVKRLTQKDISLHFKRARTKITNEKGFKLLLLKIISKWNSILDATKYFLPMAIFFFKFLEWWYSDSNRIVGSSQPIPPPPEVPKQSFGGISVPEDKSLCPLCNHQRKNPAISQSGFAFCYPCIHNYVNEYKRCPITYIPTSLDNIRKIYDDQET